MTQSLRSLLTSPDHVERCGALATLMGDDAAVLSLADLVVASIADELPIVAQKAIEVAASVAYPPSGAVAAVCRVLGMASMGCELACCGIDAFHEPALVRAGMTFLSTCRQRDRKAVECALAALVASGPLSAADAERVRELIQSQ